MQKLCFSSDIPDGESKGFQLADSNIFIVRQHGRLHCYVNACPHLGIPLEWKPDSFLDSEGELIQCSTHGALFVITSGECVSGPCLGKYLESINIIERDNAVFLP